MENKQIHTMREQSQLIIAYLADYFDVTVDDMVSPSRLYIHTLPRHMAMKLLRDRLAMPFALIGQKLNRDHTTVIHAVQSVEDQLYIDPQYRKLYNTIEQGLKVNYGIN